MSDIVTSIEHFIPLAIITIAFISSRLLMWGHPYFHHISLISAADNTDDEEKLAKYLAHKTGGKRIIVDSAWESYVPAAKELHQLHLVKKAVLLNAMSNHGES